MSGSLLKLARVRPKRKIVFVIHSLSMGGAERVVANLSSSWVEIMGWDVTILTFTDSSSHFYALHPGVKRIALGVVGESRSVLAAMWANGRRIAVLRLALRQLAPDVTIGVMTTSNILVVLASHGLPHLVITTEHVHPPLSPIGSIWHRLRSWIYPRANRVVALTEESARWIKANCPGSQVAIIPNPIPWPLADGEPHISPVDTIPASKKMLLAVGRLVPQKGFDLLLDAFSGIAEFYRDWDLVVAGEGPERSRLEAQCIHLGLERRVHLTGRIGNVQEWYRRADLFVMSSRFEGFGLTLAEAMACGCPAVSFDCDTGPRDIIRCGVDGLLVPPDQGSVGLADALGQLMADDARRRAMGERASDVRERFSLTCITQQWEELFDDLRKR